MYLFYINGSLLFNEVVNKINEGDKLFFFKLMAVIFHSKLCGSLGVIQIELNKGTSVYLCLGQSL